MLNGERDKKSERDRRRDNLHMHIFYTEWDKYIASSLVNKFPQYLFSCVAGDQLIEIAPNVKSI